MKFTWLLERRSCRHPDAVFFYSPLTMKNGKRKLKRFQAGVWFPHATGAEWDEHIGRRARMEAAVRSVWSRFSIDMCHNIIRHYWKEGGTLEKCLAAEGGRFSKPRLSDTQ
eukprot:SAG25_NODE_235_length_11344_cov_3.848911_12_plen_111_part_00